MNDHSSEGYYLIYAWFNTIASFDSWRTTNGYGKCTNYYSDSSYTAYTDWTDTFMPGNNYIPKYFLIDRDNNVRVAMNSTTQSDWNGWVEELL